MLGYGFVSLDLGNSQFLYAKYEINVKTGFQFYWIASRGDAITEWDGAKIVSEFLDLLPDTVDSTTRLTGNTTLFPLPASPREAFYNIRLSVDPTTQIFSLTVQSDAEFGGSPKGSARFTNLSLTLTQSLDPEPLAASSDAAITVSGTVDVVILGHSVPCTVQLQEAQLILTPASADAALMPIFPGGELTIMAMTLEMPSPALASPQVFYTFGATDDTQVYDCAQPSALTAPPLHLALQASEAGAVQRLPGGLALSKPAITVSQDPSATDALITAFQDTGAITIGAWIKPAQSKQSGPARIVTLSKNTGERYITLGHGGSPDNPTDNYIIRLRTDSGNTNGISQVLETEDFDAPTEPTYVVYTLAAPQEGAPNDSPHTATFYINGLPNNSKTINTQFSPGANHPWRLNDPEIRLALGNEVSAFNASGAFVSGNNRSWLGEFYEVAIYTSALTRDDIYQRYYPTLTITGQLTLPQMPAPLNQPLIATLDIETRLVESDGDFDADSIVCLVATRDQPLTVTEQLTFTRSSFEWHTPASQTAPDWTFIEGTVESQLWDDLAIQFKAEAVESAVALGQFRLVAAEADLDLSLFANSEPLRLTALTLTPQRPDTTEAWQWQMTSATEMAEIQLPRSPDGRPFDWTVDFKLLFDKSSDFSPLAIVGDRVVVQGTWLGAPLAFTGQTEFDHFVLNGSRSLTLPFATSLGDVYAPGTSHKILAATDIESVMAIDLIVELREPGFLASGEGMFDWIDTTGTKQVFKVPQFTLTSPPQTPNQVLAAALDTLQVQATTIVAEHLRHAEDYYCQVINGVTVIYLSDHEDVNPLEQSCLLDANLLINSTLDEEIESGPFKLAAKDDGHLELTIAAPAIDENYPVTLWQNYTAFLEALDQITLRPGALTILRHRIAERLAIPLADGLYYFYGLQPAQGTAQLVEAAKPNAVDLQVGMRLRVDYQSYQFVHPALSSATSGFVGSGTSYYDLTGSRGGMPEVLNFDAFLSQLQPFVNTEVTKDGAASSLDTFRVGSQRPYWQLVYPSQTSGSDGSLDPEQAATLVGFSRLADLASPSDRVKIYFRGRATVIPEIAVFVEGQPTFVSVGTTLGQLLERFVNLPDSDAGTMATPTDQAPRVSRLLHQGPASTPEYRFVNLREGASYWDLPLVKGDRILLNC